MVVRVIDVGVLEWLEAVGGIALVRVALLPCWERRWYEEHGLRWYWGKPSWC